MIWRVVVRGVPQGSVLELFLCNLAYDAVLQTTTPPDVAHDVLRR